MSINNILGYFTSNLTQQSIVDLICLIAFFQWPQLWGVRGLVVKVLDFSTEGLGFESQPGHGYCILGQGI